MGFSAGGIQAGEFLLNFDEDVLPTALDPDYVPDELDAVPAHAAAAGYDLLLLRPAERGKHGRG